MREKKENEENTSWQFSVINQDSSNISFIKARKLIVIIIIITAPMKSIYIIDPYMKATLNSSP